MKNVLVTGGAGFIGSHVVDRLLQADLHVTVVDNFSTGRPENLAHLKDNKNLALIRADIAQRQEIASAFKGIDTVFHLAALADIVPSIVDPAAYYASNVDGTFSVVESCRQAGVRTIVYAASSSCYGIPDSYPTTETCPARPQYPYALTKYLGEQLVLHWSQVYKMSAVALRLFNVYGTRSRTSGTYGAVFGVFLAQKLAKKPLTIVGDGTQTRDFVYVTDVAEAFFKAASADVRSAVLNVGSGNPQSVNTLASLLGGEKVHIPKRPGEPDCTWADITRIKQSLGWSPQVSFEEGVKRVLENIDYWRQAPVWTPEKIAEATQDWFKYLSQ